MSQKAMEVVKNLDIKRVSNRGRGRVFSYFGFIVIAAVEGVTRTLLRPSQTLQNEDGTVHVLNETWSDGKRGYIEGTAYKADPRSEEAKLKVKLYVPPFLAIIPVVGDYWVLCIDDDYQYALIGQPSWNYLWILCRQTHMDGEIYNQLVQKAEAVGYALSKLHRTPQSDSPPQVDDTTKGVCPSVLGW
ncbi:temperature-induced lipocalin-1-like [Hibiscus syriacus]|uniref:temperature-induced lipocalin-1-like n=1 Tax=Hibiscus syriacus TaxID=106335 RepID=UPI001923D299|nr:temperature-induced lipocalin-1-like [Hibiscus syriacus]